MPKFDRRLETDSAEYDLLARAVNSVKNERGISIEFGLRKGGGSQYMMEELFKNEVGGRAIHVAVDPYGGLPYEWKQDTVSGWTYGNEMRDEALSGLYELALRSNVNFQFYNMTDELYFKLFSDGIPIYEDGEEEFINTYTVAHLDAVHSREAIARQVEFIAPRMIVHGKVILDDVEGFYDTAAVEEHLFANGYRLMEKGSKKASYEKV